jgi:capsular polysaccharide transport system permease protein
MFKYPLTIVYTFALSFTLSLGAAILVSVYGTLYEGIGKMVSIVSRPLMLLSCVIHSIRDMPQYIQDILLWNPLVHLVNVGRYAFLGIPLYREENLAYPAKWAAITLGLGLLAYYANRFRLIQE